MLKIQKKTLEVNIHTIYLQNYQQVTELIRNVQNYSMLQIIACQQAICGNIALYSRTSHLKFVMINYKQNFNDENPFRNKSLKKRRILHNFSGK